MRFEMDSPASSAVSGQLRAGSSPRALLSQSVGGFALRAAPCTLIGRSEPHTHVDLLGAYGVWFGQGGIFFGFLANVNVEFFVSGPKCLGNFSTFPHFFASRPCHIIAHTEVGAEHTDTPPAGRPPLPYTTTTLRTTLLTPTNTPNALLYSCRHRCFQPYHSSVPDALREWRVGGTEGR